MSLGTSLKTLKVGFLDLHPVLGTLMDHRHPHGSSAPPWTLDDPMELG